LTVFSINAHAVSDKIQTHVIEQANPTDIFLASCSVIKL